MSLKERIKELANQRGISLPALEAELGFGNSTIVKWDKSTPNAEKLNAVAKYFGVSMDYLLNGVEEKKSPELTAKDMRDIKRNVDNIMESLDAANGEALYYDGIEVQLTDETKDLLRNALTIAMQAVKLENKEKYNPHKNGK